MDTKWLDEDELAAWVRLAAVVELLPGVLDSQLRRDAELTHFEYFVLAMLSEAPQRTLRMTALARRPTPPCPGCRTWSAAGGSGPGATDSRVREDARATNARLTPAGWSKVRDSAPGHVANVRQHVMDALTPEQVVQLTGDHRRHPAQTGSRTATMTAAFTGNDPARPSP